MRFTLLLSLVVVAFHAGCASAPASSAGAAGSPAASPAAAVITGESGEALQKGMAAAEVRRIMGPPDEIQAQPAPSGKAEVWVYRRATVGSTKQVQVGVRPITQQVLGSDGTSRTVTLAQEPVYMQAHTKTTQTIRLLMYNDQFIEQKVISSSEEVFE